MNDDRDVFRFLRRGILAAAIAACLPPILAALTGDVRLTRPTVAIALLGICSGLSWLAVAATWRRTEGRQTVQGFLIAAAIVSLASGVARRPERNWDYLVTYELPAQQLTSGINPYVGGETTNPPTWAQITALTAYAIRHVALPTASDDAIWFWVFYAYQVLQLALVAVLLGLAYRIARDEGRASSPAVVIAGVALVVCSPLHESLHLNQLNLLVLVLTIVAVKFGERRAWAAGVAAGFGGAVKLYPFGVALLWLVRRQVRPLAATAVVATSVAVAGWSGWVLYLRYLQDFQRPAIVRDAGLHAIASNLTRAAAAFTNVGDPAAARASLVLWMLLDVAVMAWITRRQRAGDASPWEVIAALPLIFPLAWVHHYLLVLPLGVARFSSGALASPVTASGCLLALVLPAFDSFPLGLTRPIGTLLLIAGAARAVERSTT